MGHSLVGGRLLTGRRPGEMGPANILGPMNYKKTPGPIGARLDAWAEDMWIFNMKLALWTLLVAPSGSARILIMGFSFLFFSSGPLFHEIVFGLQPPVPQNYT